MHQTRRAQKLLIRVIIGMVTCVWFYSLIYTWSPQVQAEGDLRKGLYAVGMTQLEYADVSEGGRPLDLMLIYPAAPSADAVVSPIFMASNLHLYKDSPIAPDGAQHPLIVFSHGAGGNGSIYAWFGEYLASHGYIVAMVYHFRANTYDSSAIYVRNRIWQRPRDLTKDISFLLQDKRWGSHIDPDRIGVAGHSQGGFTSLWIGGAKINPELFTRYQRRWKNNDTVPAYIRDEMMIDSAPALDVQDSRIKAAFAMAPGDIQGFGMDATGLRQMEIPTYLIVGAGDTTTPPDDNAAFAAKYIPHARLDILSGPVGHEIFDNECDQLGRDNYPESCNDAAGVDRAALHRYIGRAALNFFDASLLVRRAGSK
jgi:predicted dienelactone hydrolase